MRPEGPRPTDEVLPEPGLRLVDAHRGAAAQWGAGVGGIYALFVEGVASLVHRAEEGWCEPVPIEPGGNTHVARTEVYAEGVDGTVLSAPLPVVAEGGDHLTSELLLPSLAEGAL